jgi:hypothetical protein
MMHRYTNTCLRSPTNVPRYGHRWDCRTNFPDANVSMIMQPMLEDVQIVSNDMLFPSLEAVRQEK